MNERVFVQFYIKRDEFYKTREILREYYFVETEDSSSRGFINTIDNSCWHLVSGTLESEAATALALKHRDIAEGMSISYISENLKDRYRL
jgi:hypothetical protein